MKKFVLLSILLCGFSSLAAMPQVGEKAPNFTLISDSGKEVSLSDLAGKSVVLYFYPMDNTPACVNEALGFAKLEKYFAKKKVAIVGISVDDLKSHQSFKEKRKLPFTLLSDSDKKTSTSYGVLVTKTILGKTITFADRVTFLIDENGVIQKIISGINPALHAQEALKSL
jgi:thioredoxin-dependent peroxiredoxin